MKNPSIQEAEQERRFSEIAEKIIKSQGLTFALACEVEEGIQSARGRLRSS